jgi:hypothetical protein
MLTDFFANKIFLRAAVEGCRDIDDRGLIGCGVAELGPGR